MEWLLIRDVMKTGFENILFTYFQLAFYLPPNVFTEENSKQRSSLISSPTEVSNLLEPCKTRYLAYGNIRGEHKILGASFTNMD